MSDRANARRIFFALWPDDAVRQQIYDTFNQSPQSKLNGRIMRPNNLHITLHFIGNVSDEKINCLHQQARQLAAESFVLNLDHYGYFYKPRVFWMGCHQVPDNLKKLYKELGILFHGCNYEVENRPYAPHITLMRKLNRPGDLESFSPISWQLNDFVMVESVTCAEGVEYKVLQRYPLLHPL
ncbi:MAG: RNA 2',3'-cyclic phosphodiesterase [Gammaproteobacteria bacterium]|nr:RNA 2',3'-cyclic phosphodiesterase [Gammaproteobacteria bacterium]